MEKQPFEDVFPIEHGDFPLSYNKFAEGYRVYRFSVILCFNSHGFSGGWDEWFTTRCWYTCTNEALSSSPASWSHLPCPFAYGVVVFLVDLWFKCVNDGLVAMGIHGRQISKRNLLTIWLGWRYVRIAAVLSRYQHVPTVYVMRLDIICATQHSSWDWQSVDMLRS